jgi:hypothetical protein
VALTAVVVATAGATAVGSLAWPRTTTTDSVTTPSRRAAAVAHGPAGRPLDIGRTRGALGQDTAFLAALKAHVLTLKLADWRGTPVTLTSKDVEVYYAGECGGRRRALVQVQGRGSAGPGYYSTWLDAEPGAAADKLVSTTSVHTAKGPVDVSEGQEGPSTCLVYVTSANEAIRVAGAPVFGADGTMRRPVREVWPSADGLVELTPGPAELYSLPTLGVDLPQRIWQPAFPPLQSASESMVDAALPFVHTGSAFVTGYPHLKGELASDLARAQSDTGLSDPRFLWAGPLDGPSTTGQVVVLKAPSGANVVVALMKTIRGGGSLSGQMSTALPAGPLDRLSVAWAATRPERREPDPDHPQAMSVAVVGPVGAARARMTDRTGTVIEATLTNGGGFLPLRTPDSQGATVDLLDPGGAVLATTKVLPLGTNITSSSGF